MRRAAEAVCLMRFLCNVFLLCVFRSFRYLLHDDHNTHVTVDDADILLGGLFGAIGYEEHSPEELAFTFQITESAVLKAKEKALARLRDGCLNGELGVWREVRRTLR